MNPLESSTVAQLVLWAVGAVLAAVFGKPIAAAWKTRRTKQEIAGAADADAERAKALFVTTEFREADDAVTRWAARAERAERGRDEAVESKRVAIEQAIADVSAAREDVHNVRNAAMVDIAAARKVAESEIARIQHAAEATISALRGEIAILLDKLADRDREHAVMAAKYETCCQQNQDLTEMLEKKYPRFDPRRTDTNGPMK